MESELNEHRMLVRYLMGELGPEEQKDVEERYFEDDALFSELLAVEGELVEDYLQGRLSREDHGRFEAAWLRSPARRERLELTRSVLGALSGPRTTAAPAASRRALRLRWLGAVAAGIAVLVTVDDVRLRVRVRQAERQVADLLREREELQRRASGAQDPGTRVPEPVTSSPAPGSVARTVTLALAAGLVRGGGPGRQLVLVPGVEEVVLELERPAEAFPRYRAILHTSSGAAAWNGTVSGAGDRPLRAVVPAGRLARGDYHLALLGLATDGPRPVADYFFRVASADRK